MIIGRLKVAPMEDNTEIQFMMVWTCATVTGWGTYQEKVGRRANKGMPICSAMDSR